MRTRPHLPVTSGGLLSLSGQVDVGSDNGNVSSHMGTQMLVENNVFRNTGVAVTTNRSSDVDGYANLCGNDLGGAATEISRVGTFTAPPYGYTAESASVTSGAGAGKL
ncbi:pectate lyase [Streptomyces canus]|nr:pectate lyase [Streptomyces canus]